MSKEANEITVNGIDYVSKDSVTQAAQSDAMQYAIVRTINAGVFAGYVKTRTGQEIQLVNARRLWYWKGAATLSQLAMEGVKCPLECKFPCEVAEISLTEVIEVTPATQKAFDSIKEVPTWTV